MNPGDVLRWIYCLQQSAPACGLTVRGVTMLSSSQGCQLFNSALILQLRHNGRESSKRLQCVQNAGAHAHSYSRDETYSMLLRQ